MPPSTGPPVRRHSAHWAVDPHTAVNAAIVQEAKERDPGKDHDTESNLDYFYARYYSETLGRFMTPDWAAAPAAVPYADYGDPQSLNLYAYAGNNAVNGFDADGHDSETSSWGADGMADWEEGMDQAEAGQENMEGAADMAGAEGADPDSVYAADSGMPTAPGDGKKPIKVSGETVHVYGHVPPPPPAPMPLYPPGEHFPSLPYPAPYNWDPNTTATFLIGPADFMQIQRGACWMRFEGCMFSVNMAWAERYTLTKLSLATTTLTTAAKVANAKRLGENACFSQYIQELNTFEPNINPNSPAQIHVMVELK